MIQLTSRQTQTAAANTTVMPVEEIFQSGDTGVEIRPKSTTEQRQIRFFGRTSRAAHPIAV